MKRCLNCMKEYSDEYSVCPFCGYTEGSLPKEIYHLYPGMMLINRYIIGTVLGFGGFGITYRAWDNELGVMVAIKEFYPNGLVNRVPGEKKVIIYQGSRSAEYQKQLKRFLEEAQNMAKFSTHFNIVNVYNFFEENNTAYIVMEFLNGISFKEYIKQSGGKVEESIAVSVIMSVLDALKEVHKHHIIHRDISADNIFICIGGKIKLIDFGAARFATGESEATMSVILKPGFAPPEQYQTKSKQSAYTDLYAVGAMLYQAVTGVKPEESINRKIEDTLIRPKILNPEVSTNLDNVIMRAMAINPEIRFQSAEEFQNALTNKNGVRDANSEISIRKKQRIRLILVISMVIVVGICSCIFLFRKSHSTELEETLLSIWYCADNDEEIQMMNSLFDDFKTTYPQISIELSSYSIDEYQKKLDEAAQNNSLPDLFESTEASAEVISKTGNLSKVYNQLSKDKYFFVNEYNEFFPDGRQIPLGFSVPIIICNASLISNDIDIKSIKDMESISETIGYVVLPKEYPCYVSSLYEMKEINLLNILSANLDHLKNYYKDKKFAFSESGNEYHFFTGGKVGLMLADTSYYDEIQGDMAGLYEISYLKSQYAVGRFDDCYSMNGLISKNKKNVVYELLTYMLSDKIQDVLHIQYNHSLPINKKEYDIYMDINRELSGVTDTLDNIYFIGQGQSQINDWIEENAK